MESISRISSLLETARDLTLEAARDASNVRRAPTKELPSGQLKKLLDSRTERDVLEGLRRVVTMSYRQPPSQTLPFFSHVIKNVASPSLQVKKLVYIYLLQHAEHEPDTALLSINTIQKSLTDTSPQLRALALRVMSSIRVPVISQIVSLGIKRGSGDMSPYVRRAAALAIPKCYRLDPNTEPQLLDYLSTLLGDKQYFVTGAAVSSFLELCPDRLDLIHPHYRSLVRKLVDMDEWGQLATLRLMVVYARKCFPRRTKKVKKTAGNANSNRKSVKSTKGFYDSESGSDEEEEKDMEEIAVLDPDLELLLKACQSLLQSRNAAVVIAVARTYLYLGTPEYLTQAIGPLVSLLRSAEDIQHMALHNIVQVCLAHPEPFVKYYTHFLVRSTDAPHIWRLKLELLTLIFPHAQLRLQSLILAELSHFSHSGSLDPALVKESVRAIGRCSQSPATSPQTSARCLKLLLKHIGSADTHLVAESLEVIRHLIQRDPNAHRTTVVRLAKHLDAATSPQARASIIWLVGEFAGIDPENNIAADVLRILVKGFADEAEPAKLQIVLLAAKVYVHHLATNPPPEPAKAEELKPSPSLMDDYPEEQGGFRDEHLGSPPPQSSEAPKRQKPHVIETLYNYVLLLVRYDTSYDVRDRARVYRALLATPTSTQLATLLLLAPKPVPHIPSPSEMRKGYVLGSASLVVGDEGGVGGLRGYEDLPRWVKEGDEPDSALRDESIGNPSSTYVSAYESAKNMSAAERLDAAAGSSSRMTPDSMMSPRSLNGMGGDMGVGGASKAPQKEKTLDDWLAEEEEETDSEEETDDEEESEEESEYETDNEDEDEDEGERDQLIK
ncbi:ARM repeat-containing protein [Decorospora gaudefroyi]|uniref:ARM repeat-containing protein n=1 Tax=Decorospora gaudefroyi TaxID=184978 RepID=A0A6A5KRH8_9PLEO|nr:ARM repeat-containing protein [Decorospora gaudefroyi]